MDFGAKIREARLAAGLSQKQLCGEQITRNMLSQIENGSARPSMKTLSYLAQQLGKPASYFLEENSAVSSNQQSINEAKAAFALGNLEEMRRALDVFQEPDTQLYEERQLLEFYWHMEKADQALRGGMIPYGIKLLHRALELDGLYITKQLRYRCRVLLALYGDTLPLEADDEGLLARARQCVDPMRKLEILAAAEERTTQQWLRLQGEALLAVGHYAEAVEIYSRADPSREVYEKLEICYRELGDYKKAYEYACKQRQEVT